MFNVMWLILVLAASHLMWIFTRQQARNESLVGKARSIAVAKGIDVSARPRVCPEVHQPDHVRICT